MCGIAGFCSEKLDRQAVISAMMARMLHRGPDAGGVWMDDATGWTFGHRRLSVVDLSEAGAQPMHSASGRFVITFNGEIYNHHAIRKRLIQEQKVIAFRGNSDTEVLLEAIEAYGVEKTLEMSKGMFAFALYDRKEQTLILARDRAGEKPLYYGMIDDGVHAPFFAFASDCALFRCVPGFKGKISRDALAQYFMYKYVAAPLSIYEGIYKLPAGSVLYLRHPYHQPKIRRYWSAREAARKGEEYPFRGSFEEAKEQLEALLIAAIKDQMVADVPVGSFLSGGIDSPLVTSVMQSVSSVPVKTFTIGYDDPKVNEANFARDIAHHLGTNHTELLLTEKEMQALIPQMPYYYSEPCGDSSLISTFFVSRLARSQVTVSLSGDGGDELFCGYPRYWQTADLWKKLNSVPYSLRAPIGKMIQTSPFERNDFFYKASHCLTARNVNQIKELIQYRRVMEAHNIVLGGSIRKFDQIEAYVEDPFCAVQLDDFETVFVDDYLYKVDRAGMASSLENRIPLLDRDIIEFAWSLPSTFKFDGVSKKILREILYGYVPKEMMERPKQGFWVPIKKWLREGDTYEYANELLNNCWLAQDGYIDRSVVDNVWSGFQKTGEGEALAYAILIAEQWYRAQT